MSEDHEREEAVKAWWDANEQNYVFNFTKLDDSPKATHEIDLKIKKSTQDKIIDQCDMIKAMLLDKNSRYGDSAIHPVRVFSKADPVEQLKVRLDDKLSRLAKGEMDDSEDVLLDLVGYLVLLLVARDGSDLPSEAPQSPPNALKFNSSGIVPDSHIGR